MQEPEASEKPEWDVVQVGLASRFSAAGRWPVHSGEAHLLLRGRELSQEDVVSVQLWGDARATELRCVCFDADRAHGASDASRDGDHMDQARRSVGDSTLVLVKAIQPSRQTVGPLIPAAIQLAIYQPLVESLKATSDLRLIVSEQPGSMALSMIGFVTNSDRRATLHLSPEDIQFCPSGHDRAIEDAFEAANRTVNGIVICENASFFLGNLEPGSAFWTAQLMFVRCLERFSNVNVILIDESHDMIADHVRKSLGQVKLLEHRSPLVLAEWMQVLPKVEISLATKACGLTMTEVQHAFEHSLRANTLDQIAFEQHLEDKASLKTSSVVVSPELPFTFVPAYKQGKTVPQFDSFCTRVIGQVEAKKALYECLILPHQVSETPQIRRFLPRGVLLYGPPGAGKTFLVAEACAESNVSLLSVSASDLVRGEVGTTEKRIARLFALAKACAPSVLFLDEAEVLLTNRKDASVNMRKTITQFMLEMDELAKATDAHKGSSHNVVLIAATNILEQIDSAFLRQGRLARQIKVGGLCSSEEFVQVFKRATEGDARFSGIDWPAYVRSNFVLQMYVGSGPLARGLTGAQLTQMIYRAIMESKDQSRVSHADLDRAVQAEAFAPI